MFVSILYIKKMPYVQPESPYIGHYYMFFMRYFTSTIFVAAISLLRLLTTVTTLWASARKT